MALYFAYGSNMLVSRLKQRVSSASYMGKAVLKNFTLEFQKMSKDGSTKANIILKNGASVYGVLYHISYADKSNLDSYEGRGYGYEKINILVETDPNDTTIKPVVEAYTYIAPLSYLAKNYSWGEHKWIPYDWYLKYCVDGAIENDLPEDYIDWLKARESKIDDGNREFLTDTEEWLPKFMNELHRTHKEHRNKKPQ